MESTKQTVRFTREEFGYSVVLFGVRYEISKADAKTGWGYVRTDDPRMEYVYAYTLGQIRFLFDLCLQSGVQPISLPDAEPNEWCIHTTERENEILRAAWDQPCGFTGGVDGGTPWVFAVIDESGIPATEARGVLSSLVKKGLVQIDDYEGKARPDDMILSFTMKGKDICSGMFPEVVKA